MDNIRIFCPYRISLLGAHIDHQLGIVCGGAINLGITIDFKVRKDKKIILKSDLFDEIFISSIENCLSRSYKWYDYLIGVVRYLRPNYNLTNGIEGKIISDLPSGGISSSSSLQIAFALTLAKANNFAMDKLELIELVYRVEREFMGINIGYLDPFSEVMSKKNCLIFLDPATKFYRLIENKEFNINYQFIIIYSGIERSLKDSKYNKRIEECQNAFKKMNDEPKCQYVLRNIPKYKFELKKGTLSPVELKRTTHFYEEVERVKLGYLAWKKNDIKALGILMNESCQSSIKNYESGSVYLQYLQEILLDTDGVVGSRFLGAGFNGSSVAIIWKNKFNDIAHVVYKKYIERFPKLKDKFKVIPVSLEDGV